MIIAWGPSRSDPKKHGRQLRKPEAGARYQLAMAEHQVLFCPFCRESFEAAPDASLCPEHELPLVSFDQLAVNSEQTDSEDADDAAELDGHSPGLSPEDRPLAAYDPGLGRGVVGLGALLNAAALGL